MDSEQDPARSDHPALPAGRSAIAVKGGFRDPIRSTANKVTKALGIRWIVLAIVVPVPWSERGWALPFMTIPTRSPKTSAKLNRRHRTLVGWADAMIQKVRRWQPDRELILVGDGTYAAVRLIYGFLRSKAIGLGATVFALNGVEDHVHLVVAIPPKITVAKFIGQVKVVASIKLNKAGLSGRPFFWQAEYGVFSFAELTLC